MPVGEDIGRSRRGGKKRGGKSSRGGSGSKGLSTRGNQPPGGEEGGDNSQGTYSKRKIENNWTKYNEPENEIGFDEPSSSNKDYKLLLSQASGGACAHLKLKNEEAWLQDINEFHVNSLLNVNNERLSQCLLSIPLHKQLRIDEEYFSAKQLKDLELIAMENHDKYIMKIDLETLDVRSDCSKEGSDSQVTDEIDASYHSTHTSDNFSGNLLTREKLDSLESEIVQSSLKQTEPPTFTSQPVREQSLGDGGPADDNVAEDELDFLLSLTPSNPDKSLVEKSSVSQSKDEKQDGTGLDDWLDSILDD